MYIYVGYVVNKGGRLVWRSRAVDSVRGWTVASTRRTRIGGESVRHKNNTGIDDGVDDSEKRARSN